jgi:hypothetical protein
VKSAARATAREKPAYVPALSDATVEAKTAKSWAAWFFALDTTGAAKLDHRGIVRLLSETHGVPSWWCQTIAVEYERARGLRAPHQTPSGFSVAVSKTIAASVSDVYDATAKALVRAKWFPRGTFEVSSQTKDKYFRGSWKKTARAELGFLAKGAGKAQIAVHVGKLEDEEDVEAERAAWKGAFEKLAALIE